MVQGLTLVVGGGHEWHLGDGCVILLAAHLDLQLGACLLKALGHIAHGDVLLQAGAVRAAGHLSDHLAVRAQDLAVLAGRGTAGDESDALLAHPLSQLLLDDLSSEEVKRGPPPLAYTPGQTRLNGRDVLVEVVAVQAQARLQAQAVTSTQACQLDSAVADQSLGQLHGVGVGHADLKPVLASVPGPCHPDRDALHVKALEV
mmetsp:Transcript_14061/g.30455  ORF Transcript_14061/g.30455 Transcript_14061/m.30455 type:complete len:202 (-) Transcript_14061:678-1283(-)